MSLSLLVGTTVVNIYFMNNQCLEKSSRDTGYKTCCLNISEEDYSPYPVLIFCHLLITSAAYIQMNYRDLLLWK